MTRSLVAAVGLTLLLAGCGIKIVPQPTAGGIINPADRSIAINREGIIVSARVQDLEVAPYRMVDNITSFYVVIDNRSTQEVLLPVTSFVLLDQDNRQYRPIHPGEVQAIVTRDSTYLIPYPFVGYYYLEDQQKGAVFNTFSSSLPYFAENHPQDLHTEALRETPILPGALISGKIYFVIDLATHKKVELRLYPPGTDTTRPAHYVFPFSIEK
jgi:hypothetical protein